MSSDILSHSVDLAHMLIGGIEKVVGMGHIQIPERPLPKPGGTHYDVGKPGDPTGTVENEDYFGAMCVLRTVLVACSSRVARSWVRRASARSRCTARRVADVEPRDDERTEAVRASEPELGYKTVYSGDRFPYHGHFVPGDANPIGYEDLKVIEEFEYLSSVANGRQHTPGFAEAIDYVSVQDAMLRSWKSEKWETVERLSRATDPSHPGLHQEIMETIRLTTADAIVRYLIAQKSVMPDGSIAPLFPGVSRSSVTATSPAWVTRSSSIKTNCRPGGDKTSRAWRSPPPPTRRRCVVARSWWRPRRSALARRTWSPPPEWRTPTASRCC